MFSFAAASSPSTISPLPFLTLCWGALCLPCTAGRCWQCGIEQKARWERKNSTLTNARLNHMFGISWVVNCENFPWKLWAITQAGSSGTVAQLHEACKLSFCTPNWFPTPPPPRFVFNSNPISDSQVKPTLVPRPPLWHTPGSRAGPSGPGRGAAAEPAGELPSPAKPGAWPNAVRSLGP